MNKALHVALQLKALVWVWAVRIALWLFSFRNVRRGVAFLTRKAVGTKAHPSAEHFSLAICTASRWVPKATCLTKAVALHILLRRAGLQSRIRIGVAKDAGNFEAHAWVEHQEKVVIGDIGLQRFVSILECD
jgi:hypothetical protein